jgi:hypothetical protein
MHTLKVVSIGFGLLAFCLLAGRMTGSRRGISTAALAFIPLWFAGAGVNLLFGVKSAGYSVGEELPVFAFVFAIPAMVAAALWWKLH